MLESPQSPGPSTRDRLVSLLDYVEQVVRLDERVAFTLEDYRLADGKPASFGPADTSGLPGVVHDGSDEHGPVWLAVERLARGVPPVPPDALAPWLKVSADPGRSPEPARERTVEVDAAGRSARLGAGACPDDFKPVEAADPGEPPRFTLVLRLADQPGTADAIDRWVGGVWAPWSEREKPRRRAVALYEGLYKLLQQVELGGAEAPVELVWGIGVARWRDAGRSLRRPFLERAVDLELDEAANGLIRVRPTVADAAVDLKPYEEMGCANLAALDDLIRREVDRAAADEGVSPFRPDSFEPILAGAAARLHPEGAYLPDGAGDEAATGAALTIDGSWVLFARPRSAHVVLADIDKLRGAARDPDRAVEGLAARLVMEPSAAEPEGWRPLAPTLGDTAPEPDGHDADAAATEVFFPKPFNDDQVAIVRRLARSDGLVVQGPPGTGKTHTIANLICHCMATGQRVLVVSRGEAALSVLRDQLPDKVRPLAIALLSNERQGLRQVETAVREVQAVVESGRPEVRRRAIAMAETEIVKLRHRIAGLDAELDALAAVQAGRMGPGSETPAALALRIAAERDAHAWFTDRPAAYAAETGLTDADVAALAGARRRVGALLDHLDAALPSPHDLPHPEEVAGWHDLIRKAADLADGSVDGPARGLRLGAGDGAAADALATGLDRMAQAGERLRPGDWIRAYLLGRDPGPWQALFASLCDEWLGGEADRAAAVAQAVDLPPGLLDDPDARGAVARAARGDRAWPLISVGKARAKALVAAVRVRGAPVPEGDAAAWRHVDRRVAGLDRARDLDARWRAFAAEAGGPGAEPGDLAAAAAARRRFGAARDAFGRLAGLPATAPAFDRLAADPALARALAAQLRQAAEALRLEAVRAAAEATAARFEGDGSRTAAMARRFFVDVLGRADVDAARIAPTWKALTVRLDQLRAFGGDFATVARTADAIASAGAPDWAARLRAEPAPAEGADPLAPAAWRAAWDWAAADAELTRTDARAPLASLANRRAEAERNVARLFTDLVRERTFHALERRLSPAVKSALVQFVSALSRLGKGTGKGAGKQRRAARDAMRRCYDAVPCWIMPTWRVAEQLPADLAAFDLVILDEASQSDVTELPAVLRGRKILVVGDDRQVSPVAPFVSQARVDQLRLRHLRGLPFATLLEPGESLYTLMQAVFPEERLMLREHFRCVEPIVRFSMQFYPEGLLPLRVPTAAERLDPPLVDIHVPHGARDGGRKLNRAEADVIVAEVALIAADPAMADRTVGVISLIGGEQAELVRTLLTERLGAEAMQRHAVLCGDSATFQGNERDVVFLSMVADRARHQALTMRRYEQRFNVAASRARDRLVLVRSVERDDLNPRDLKARLIAHFEDPMPAGARRDAADALDRCESGFERDVMGRLLALGYRVEPQVGALGFRIDLVVEGEGGRRLAVECDGDRFHGPAVWREDMRRQRVLERVGWRFWRCFASSFYRDPDGTVADLVATLARHGVEPVPRDGRTAGPSPFVEHRVAAPPTADTRAIPDAPAPAGGTMPTGMGDRVVLAFADGRKPLALTLAPDADGPGAVALDSPLGQALLGREEDEEIELPLEGRTVRASVERVERAVRPAPERSGEPVPS